MEVPACFGVREIAPSVKDPNVFLYELGHLRPSAKSADAYALFR
jgi:hypothetical protein